MKKVLFIDRDGTLVIEPPVDLQLDSLEKLEFYPGVFQWLSRIVRELDYEIVMVDNKNGAEIFTIAGKGCFKDAVESFEKQIKG